MKTTALELSSESSWRLVLADLKELTKAGLTFFVLLTTLAGFYLAQEKPLDGALLFNTLFGTTLVAAASAALNQFIERKADAKMRRTENRPLVTNRIPGDEVVVVAAASAIVGVIYLGCAVNEISALLAALTFVIYLWVYTPLKMKSRWNTLVGAIPGALPPLIGWTAIRGSIDFNGLLLFAILFLWQIPHFMAIAWKYKDDYAAGGFKMMPLFDDTGRMTARHSFVAALLLIPVSLLAVLMFHHWVYLIGAALCSGTYAWFAYRFWKSPERIKARQLFFCSLFYIPLQLGWMATVKAFFC